MPIYTFLNKTTNEQFTQSMSISERNEFLKDENFEQLIVSAPSIGDSYRLGIKKVPGDFRGLLSQIKKNNYKSTIETPNISEI